MSADLEACTRSFINDLVGRCDPFIKNRYSSFKQMAVKHHGPSFLQRMRKDHDVRKQVTKVIQHQVTLDDVKQQASITSLEDSHLVDEVFSPKK